MARVALVTGGSRGIGAAISKGLKAAGYQVAANYAGNDDAAQKFKNETGVPVFKWSVADYDACATGIKQVEAEVGPVDVLVNNAGITGFESGVAAHDPEHADLVDWRAVHATNLDGVFLGCKYAIRAMRRTGTGSIINISSRSGVVGIPAAAAYASSKAAVRNHTKTVALYCAEQGLKVRCNSIHPAAILTPMWEPMLGDGPERAANMAAFVADTPLRRFGLPEEVAAVALLLASDESAYVTGAEFHVDGGILAGSAAVPAPPDAKM